MPRFEMVSWRSCIVNHSYATDNGRCNCFKQIVNRSSSVTLYRALQGYRVNRNDDDCDSFDSKKAALILTLLESVFKTR